MEDQHLLQMALERGFITADHIEKAKAEQKALSDRGIERSLWFLCQDLGFVNDQQTRELRRFISSSRVKALEIDGYVIQGRLGSGGMGDVFRGRNGIGNEVAVKLLATKYAQHKEYAARFDREAKASSRLNHPHIARTLGAGTIEGQRWLMMELVQGKSLKEQINSQGPLSEEHGRVLLAQMAHALRYAWQRGVLHRDVKPANIILAPPREGVDEPFCAKLCDFGLAKTWQIAGEEVGAMTKGELTHSGVALGTPHYMSPEQAAGSQDLDQRTDIYGLGATLYHALLGQTLYSGKSSAAIMYKQVTEALDLKPVEQHGVSAGLTRLLGAMLAKERARRLRDWEAVITALRSVAPRAVAAVEGGMPVGSSSDTLHAPPGIAVSTTTATPTIRPAVKPKRSFPVGMLIGGLAVTVLLVALGGVLALSGGGGGFKATPETLAQVLLDAQRTGVPTVVSLAPGDYQGPFSFGVGHSNLTLAATGPGVRIVGPSLGNEPLVRLQTGLSAFTLRGVALVPGRRLSIDVQSGASVQLDQVRIEGGCRQMLAMGGGQLRMSGFTARSEDLGLVIDGQAELEIVDSVISSNGQLLSMRNGALRMQRCRLSAVGTTPGVLVGLGAVQATLESVVIDAQGKEIALALDHLNQGSFTNVALRGARTALRADSAAVTKISGLSADAVDVGIEWIGPRDAEWGWHGILVRAPRPAVGISGVDLAGAGASADALAAIPLLSSPSR